MKIIKSRNKREGRYMGKQRGLHMRCDPWKSLYARHPFRPQYMAKKMNESGLLSNGALKVIAGVNHV